MFSSRLEYILASADWPVALAICGHSSDSLGVAISCSNCQGHSVSKGVQLSSQ